MKDISLHKQSPYRKCNKCGTIFAISQQTEICPICYGKLELWAGPAKEKRAIQLTARATLNLVCHQSKYVGLKPTSRGINYA